MTFFEWAIFFFIIQLLHGIGSWKLYKFAGHKSFYAFIPVYNALILMRIINRPWWWVFLLFIPIINLLIIPVIWVETARSFGKNKNIDTLLAVITLGFYNYYLNYIIETTHLKDRKPDPVSSTGQFINSILFATHKSA